MQKLILLFTLSVFTAVLIYSTYIKEQVLHNGEIIRMELIPVDPRSLMQGDYMRLNFALIRSMEKKARKEGISTDKVVLQILENRVVEFKRFYDNKELKEDEILLNFRYKGDIEYVMIKIGSTSFFFQEGNGKIYEDAKYGEFRVSKNGETLLVHLLDDKYTIIQD